MFGLHFRSAMKNLSIFKCPYSAAQWMGVVPEKSLDAGSQCFSEVRNFAMYKCPLHAAWESGVCLYLLILDGSHPCSSIKDFIMCR